MVRPAWRHYTSDDFLGRSLGFCFTLNNWTEEDYNKLVDIPGYTYIILGREICPTTGTPHIQGFIQFRKPGKSWRQVKDILGRAHFERTKGTIAQNIEYCSKDLEYEEYGTRPMTDEEKGAIGKRKIQERWELAKKGKFEELNPEQIKTYQYIHRLYHTCESIDELDNIWFCGPTGTGKSRFVNENYPGYYHKLLNKWWENYSHEEVVFIDELDPVKAASLGSDIKVWSDHYPFMAEYKGGAFKIRPKKIIVCSNYTIEECFPEKDWGPLNRRFRVFNQYRDPTECPPSNSPPASPADREDLVRFI